MDGAPRFLILVSYFDGLHQAATAAGLARLDRDFAYLKHVSRVDGIRVMVNWCEGPCTSAPDTLFDSDPTHPLLRQRSLDTLMVLLSRASQHGLVVDTTFYNVPHHDIPMAAGRYRDAIVATARAVKAYRNVLFDLQSEFDCKPSGVTVTDLWAIRDAVWAPGVDPDRLVTASPCAYDAVRAGRLAAGQGEFMGNGRFSVAAFHDPRQDVPDDRKTWFTAAALTAVLSGLRDGAGPAVLPVYLQEPTAWGDDRPSDDSVPGHFTSAVRNAAAAGAAAWTFHQRAGFDLSEKSFIERLTQGVANGQAALAELNGLRQSADEAAVVRLGWPTDASEVAGRR